MPIVWSNATYLGISDCNMANLRPQIFQNNKHLEKQYLTKDSDLNFLIICSFYFCYADDIWKYQTT